MSINQIYWVQITFCLHVCEDYSSTWDIVAHGNMGIQALVYDLKLIVFLQLTHVDRQHACTCAGKQPNFFKNTPSSWRFHFYIHSLIFYIFIQGEEDKFEPLNQSLTFGDLRKSIAAVGREAAQSKFTLHQLCNSSEGVTLRNCPISKTFIFF